MPDRTEAESGRREQDESDQSPPCLRADEDEAEQDQPDNGANDALRGSDVHDLPSR